MLMIVMGALQRSPRRARYQDASPHVLPLPSRQSGRLAAREHREPHPAYFPREGVLFRRPPDPEVESLCSPHICGPPLTAKIETTHARYAVALEMSTADVSLASRRSQDDDAVLDDTVRGAMSS